MITKENVKSISIGATIPTRQYENIQPVIELQDVPLEEGLEFGMNVIKSYISRLSQHGALVERNATVKIKSFNEDVEIDFDPLTHSYFYNGVKLVSVTEFTSKFYKEFNSKIIAKTCAKSWEVPQEDIESMWESNGEMASELGTLVHKSLEHYYKFIEMGDKISLKNGKDNPAMPKHPLLKKIIEEFKVLSPNTGNIKTEVLLTNVSLGICGMEDKLLITGTKKCRLSDYKVNIDSEKEDKNMKALEPFNELPSTKITKYQIQMSIYANLLQKSGWEVEGMDVFIYEDIWKKFELPILTVI